MALAVTGPSPYSTGSSSPSHYVGAAGMLAATSGSTHGAAAMPIAVPAARAGGRNGYSRSISHAHPADKDAGEDTVMLHPPHAISLTDDDDDPSLISRSMGMPGPPGGGGHVVHSRDVRATGSTRSSGGGSSSPSAGRRHVIRGGMPSAPAPSPSASAFSPPPAMKTIMNGWSSVLQLVPYDQSLAQQSLVSTATGATPFRLLSHALDQSKVVNLRAAMHAQRPWVIFPDAHGHGYGSASPHGHGRSSTRSSPVATASRSSASPVPLAGRRAVGGSASPPHGDGSAYSPQTVATSPGAPSYPGSVSFGGASAGRAVPPISLPPVHTHTAAHSRTTAAAAASRGHNSMIVPPMNGGDSVPQPAAGAVTLTPRTRTISGSAQVPGDTSARSAGKSGTSTPSSRTRPLPRAVTAAEAATAAAMSSSGSQPGANTPRGGRRAMASASPTAGGRPPSGRTHTDTSASSAASTVSTSLSDTTTGVHARPASRLASMGATALTPKPGTASAAAHAGSSTAASTSYTTTASASGALPSLATAQTQSGGVKTRVGTFFRSLIGTSGRTSLSTGTGEDASQHAHTRPPPRTTAMMLTVTHPHTTAVPSNARPSAAPGATLMSDNVSGGAVDLLRTVDRISSGSVRRVYTAEGENGTSTTVFTDTHVHGDVDRENEAVSVHSSSRNARTGGGGPRAAYTREHAHASSDADRADGSSGVAEQQAARVGGFTSIASWILSSSASGAPSASVSRSPASARYGSNVHARVGGQLASKQSASEALDMSDGISLALDESGGMGRTHTHARGQGDIFRRLQRAALSQFIAAGGVLPPGMCAEEDESEAPLAYDETASGTSAGAEPRRRVGDASEEGDDTNARTRHRTLVHRGSDSAMP